MPYKENRGVTLTEILVIVIIIAILVILALPRYTETRERALAREALATLKLISVAQKIYHMKLGTYWPTSGSYTDAGTIGGALKLNLTETNWNYTILGGTNTFSATANRTAGPYSSCSYLVNQTYNFGSDPTGTNCP